MISIAFVDLDDTLFSTLHKHRDGADLEPAAHLRDGSIISYSSPQQRALLAWLRPFNRIIPVTARTEEAYRRVRIDFGDMAIVSHGATILHGGLPDPAWAAHVDTGLATQLPPLEILMADLREHPAALNVRLAGEPGRPAYLMAKDPDRDPDRVRAAAVDVVEPWIATHPAYTLHRNGNNLAVLPPCVNKATAVAHLIKRLRTDHGGELFLVGAGDSRSDADFMSLCDVAIVPTGAQLWRTLADSAKGSS